MDKSFRSFTQTVNNHLFFKSIFDVYSVQWSKEEDLILLKNVTEIGKKWSFISKKMPGRNENSVKNRVNAIVKILKKENSSLSNDIDVIIEEYKNKNNIICSPAKKIKLNENAIAETSNKNEFGYQENGDLLKNHNYLETQNKQEFFSNFVKQLDYNDSHQNPHKGDLEYENKPDESRSESDSNSYTESEGETETEHTNNKEIKNKTRREEEKKVTLLQIPHHKKPNNRIQTEKLPEILINPPKLMSTDCEAKLMSTDCEEKKMVSEIFNFDVEMPNIYVKKYHLESSEDQSNAPEHKNKNTLLKKSILKLLIPDNISHDFDSISQRFSSMSLSDQLLLETNKLLTEISSQISEKGFFHSSIFSNSTSREKNSIVHSNSFINSNSFSNSNISQIAEERKRSFLIPPKMENLLDINHIYQYLPNQCKTKIVSEDFFAEISNDNINEQQNRKKSFTNRFIQRE